MAFVWRDPRMTDLRLRSLLAGLETSAARTLTLTLALTLILTLT